MIGVGDGWVDWGGREEEGGIDGGMRDGGDRRKG